MPSMHIQLPGMRQMDHIAAYANASSEWWKSESDELLTVISGMQVAFQPISIWPNAA